MLTTKVITPKQGESYYAKENYYSAEESVDNSRWMGKGARKLGLKGKVKPKDFKKLLYGELPNGTKFRTRKKERTGYKERAGLDCTFSAPKSVSILALVFGRKELEKAHSSAVLETLQIIERDYAGTRVSKDGKVTVVNTGNLVVGQFHHDTSRELDPHLHTHCVILNMTEHNDRWYAFRNDDIHANKKLLGMIYQNQLAIQVKKLGYEIEPNGHGQFEIKGFTEEQLISFSKRRQQIKSQLGEESTWKEREKIWDKTRSKKGESIPREELQSYWRKEYEAQNVSYPQPNQGVGHRGQGIERNGDREKREQTHSQAYFNTQYFRPDTYPPMVDIVVAEAIEHCSERTVAFKPEEIQKFILAEVGKYQHQDLEQAISKSDELIHLDKQVTTQSALLREIATLKLVKDGKDKVKALTNKEIVDEFIEGKNLTEGQRQAVTLAATSCDQIIAWSGKAGAGKTHALNEFKEIAERKGCVVKGFAPSAFAAKVLAEELNIKTTTVARKLVSNSWKDKTERQQIWIVDEAGLLGASDAYELLKKAKAENARVLLVGDTRQLSSVAAGNPFKSLRTAGIATAYLNQSLRQKTKDLKHAVDLLSDGKVAEGINVLETNKRIKQIQDSEERANQIAIDYLKLTPSERKQTLIIAGTHQERETLSDSIRGGLKEEGSLGEDVTIQRLKSKNLTTVQKKYAHYYDSGNVVIPLSNYKRLGLEKGQQYRILAVEGDSLVLLDQAGQEKRASPAHFKYKEVYEAIGTNIAVGDRLRWGKNDKQLNRINGEEFVVTQIDKGIATIQTETGKREQIELKKPQHLDHALVSTTYSSQGVTAKKVIVSITDALTLSQESFYVAASRAKYNLQLYVENRARLIEKAQTSRAKLNPLELIREHRQKEAVTETTTSTTKHRNEQQLNKTVQPNHERNQTAEPNPQRDSDRNTQTPPPKTRGFREQLQHSSHQFRVEPTSPTTDQSVEPDSRKTRPTQAKSKPTPIEARPGIVRDVVRVDQSWRSLNRSNQEFGRVQQDFRELAERARNMPLEEVAERLGLEPDRYDSHKYKSDAHIISINDQRFYDHLNQKGGGGAIDLVMHVQDSNFKEALMWLNSNAVNLTPIKQALSFLLRPNSEETSERAVRFSKQPLEREPFEPPPADESKWRAVKHYLITTRKLPESIIDTLYQKGILYADSKQNAVFVRKDLEGEVTGASLRGTYNGSKFKGLAKGTQRDTGWFAFTKVQGEPERIILVASPIDAISAAAISQKKENTLFISTDGAGSIPHEFLQHELDKGKQVLVAFDNDEAGQTMARAILDKLPSAQRITPTRKDWNEQLLYTQGTLSLKKQIFRQEYEKLREIVDLDPNFTNKEIGNKDLAVTMLILKAEALHPTGEKLLNRVGKVLSQSDLLREWKRSMPENEFRAKVEGYIIGKLNEASKIRESLLNTRKSQALEFER